MIAQLWKNFPEEGTTAQVGNEFVAYHGDRDDVVESLTRQHYDVKLLGESSLVTLGSTPTRIAVDGVEIESSSAGSAGSASASCEEPLTSRLAVGVVVALFVRWLFV